MRGIGGRKEENNIIITSKLKILFTLIFKLLVSDLLSS